MCVLYYKLKYTRHIISYVLHITSHLRNIISNKRHNISFTYVQHIISYVYTTYYLVHTTYYVIIKTKYIMYIVFTTYPVPFLLTIISYVRNIIYYLWCSFTINSTNYNKKGLHSGEGQNNRQTAIKKNHSHIRGTEQGNILLLFALKFISQGTRKVPLLANLVNIRQKRQISWDAGHRYVIESMCKYFLNKILVAMVWKGNDHKSTC